MHVHVAIQLTFARHAPAVARNILPRSKRIDYGRIRLKSTHCEGVRSLGAARRILAKAAARSARRTTTCRTHHRGRTLSSLRNLSLHCHIRSTNLRRLRSTMRSTIHSTIRISRRQHSSHGRRTTVSLNSSSQCRTTTRLMITRSPRSITCRRHNGSNTGRRRTPHLRGRRRTTADRRRRFRRSNPTFL